MFPEVLIFKIKIKSNKHITLERDFYKGQDVHSRICCTVTLNISLINMILHVDIFGH